MSTWKEWFCWKI